jgi:hypothetical protein
LARSFLHGLDTSFISEYDFRRWRRGNQEEEVPGTIKPKNQKLIPLEQKQIIMVKTGQGD